MESLLVERREAVAVVTLNRPEVRNALSREIVDGLREAISELERDGTTRAVVLTGAGSAFSSGADLAALRGLAEASSEANKEDSLALAGLLESVFRSSLPIVAAVEGAAVAGGAGLACACDLVVCGRGSRLGFTEVRLGFVAAIVSVFLTRSVGEKHARELLLTGKLVGAEDAYRLGLVNEVVADGQALSRAIEIADEIASNSPTALAATKELLALVPAMPASEGLRYAAGLNAWVRTTADLKEGVSAFLEKRSPAWRTRQER